MYFTWLQIQSSDKKWRDSGVFLDIFPQKQNFVGSFQNFIGRKRNSVGRNLKNIGHFQRKKGMNERIYCKYLQKGRNMQKKV